MLLLSLSATFARSQPTEPGDPIQGARSDFTNTPQIVPVGRIQFEGGGTYYARGGESRERSEFGEATLRYGMQRWAELRIELPTYMWAHRAGDPDGFDNVRLSSIVYLGNAGRLDFGVQPALTIPSGAEGLEDEFATPEFYLDVARRLADGSSIRGTYGVAFIRETGRPHERVNATLSFLRPFSESLDGFMEYAGFYDRIERPTQHAHVGMRLRVTKTTQLDAHGALGLNRGTERGFVGVGYAARF